MNRRISFLKHNLEINGIFKRTMKTMVAHLNQKDNKIMFNIQSRFYGLYKINKALNGINKKSSSNNQFLAIPMFGVILRRGEGSVTRLTPKTSSTEQKIITRGARRTVNEPDPNTTDSQALHNNPLIQKSFMHDEIHRAECDADTKCKEQWCSNLCGSPKNREAIGHATHGQAPAHETDKTTVTASQTDFSGKNKKQNIVFYDNPHPVTNTPENPLGTSMINNDANIKNIIDKHEKR